jgi:hypothetical protein
MSLAFLKLAVLQPSATPPSQSDGPEGSAATAQRPIALQFLFFRLSYFHEAAEIRRCERAQPDRTRALDSRFEALRRQLVERYGAELFQSPREPEIEPGPDSDCRMGVTLLGYENALNQLERAMTGGGPGK